MKKYAIILALLFGLPLFLFFGKHTGHSAENENNCVACHTNPRKLIQITREIAKRNPPVESASKGPG
ncbi:MAG: hypothetical protein JJE15_05210 [Desulfobacteraceae bacterium]|nr:hypothetical protein [Desulfobacteraceae bacterium]